MRSRGAGAQGPRRSATIHKRPREGEGGVPCLHIGSDANFISGRRKVLLGCGKPRESSSDPGHEQDFWSRKRRVRARGATVGIGQLRPGAHPARTGHNAHTGEAGETAAAKTVSFPPVRPFKDVLNASGGFNLGA
ncbi:HU family DNA-binding protein [Caballeronia sp. AZ10_KS36]|uniref:HU family DNA-binding protein n=1 Tax=Caballeronia sp. AZ10_KS36 TaxID=2921757 RepID=UPI0020282AC1|nr:HU family DNA-binding protein [Caballeronia sp. AZ10_KS36]